MPDAPTSRLPKVDIDEYLNPLVPHPRWDILPHFISHWFGYRPPGHTPKKRSPQASSLQVWAFAFLGGFIGISIIENVYRALPRLGGHQVPTVIASFGAAAILEYNAIESPLSQPRNLVFGHFLSALIGVSITKLFQMLPPERFEDLRWLAGALAVGSASAVMGITKTVHPPAGATALLAATTPEMTDLGWWMLPLVLLACTLMLTSAMLVNNLYKRFPIYWWTPVDLKEMRRKADVVEVKDVEKGSAKQADDDSESKSSSQSHSEAGLKKNQGRGDSVSTAPRSEQTVFEMHNEAEKRIVIEEERIVVPDWIDLSQFEITALEGIQMRLQQNRAAKA